MRKKNDYYAGGGNVTFTRQTFCKKPEGAISFTFGARPQPVGFPGSAYGF